MNKNKKWEKRIKIIDSDDGGCWVYVDDDCVNLSNDKTELVGFISELISQAEDNMRKRCVEAICKRLDDLGDLCDGIPVWKSAIKDCVMSIGTTKAIDQATQNINNLDKE